MDAEEFRRFGHRLIDWVADYLDDPEQWPVLAQIQPGLPRRVLDDGTVSRVTVVPFYDRTQLIHETLDTLSTALYQQILITIIVVLIMLRNLRSSLLISAMLPLGVLGTFVIMKVVGVDANIMALGGIAIAIGTMVDIGIVFIENINQHLERLGPNDNRAHAVRRAAAEVAPAVMTSVLTTIVSFLPVFGLSSTELRLFGPLAFTKTFAMAASLLLALLVLPGAGQEHRDPDTLQRVPDQVGVDERLARHQGSSRDSIVEDALRHVRARCSQSRASITSSMSSRSATGSTAGSRFHRRRNSSSVTSTSSWWATTTKAAGSVGSKVGSPPTFSTPVLV